MARYSRDLAALSGAMRPAACPGPPSAPDQSCLASTSPAVQTPHALSFWLFEPGKRKSIHFLFPSRLPPKNPRLSFLLLNKPSPPCPHRCFPVKVFNPLFVSRWRGEGSPSLPFLVLSSGRNYPRRPDIEDDFFPLVRSSPEEFILSCVNHAQGKTPKYDLNSTFLNHLVPGAGF